MNDEQDSIDSNKAYTDKSASIRRVCRKLATITSVDDIEALKMDKASGSLSHEEMKKMRDAMDMMEVN